MLDEKTKNVPEDYDTFDDITFNLQEKKRKYDQLYDMLEFRLRELQEQQSLKQEEQRS